MSALTILPTPLAVLPTPVATLPTPIGGMSGTVTGPYPTPEGMRRTNLCTVAVAPGISEGGLDVDSDSRLFLQVYDPKATVYSSSYADTGPEPPRLTNARGNTLRLNSVTGYSGTTLEADVDPGGGFASTLSGIHVRSTVNASATDRVARAVFLNGDICSCPGHIGNRRYCKSGAGGPKRDCYGTVDYCSFGASNATCHGLVRKNCVESSGMGTSVSKVACYDDVTDHCVAAISGGTVSDVDCYRKTGGQCIFNCAQVTGNRCVRMGSSSAVSNVRCHCEEEDVCPLPSPAEDPCCLKGAIFFLDLSGDRLHRYNEASLPPICGGDMQGEGENLYCGGPVIMPEKILRSYDLRTTSCNEVAPSDMEQGVTAVAPPPCLRRGEHRNTP
ncbi:MAG: hypothetical protein OXF02_03675 [Simkaniaceae bacterium]|nr:hypothetical protein [Simkaniaceae bacterium]